MHILRGEDGTGHDYDLGRQKRSACVLQLERGDSGRKTLLNKDMEENKVRWNKRERLLTIREFACE